MYLQCVLWYGYFIIIWSIYGVIIIPPYIDIFQVKK